MKLNKRRIAEGGLLVLKEGGLENLTIRKLADHFGIKSASLYYHFRNKQELLDYVADGIIQNAFRPPRPGEEWQGWLLAIALRLRECMHAYPDGALVCAGASPPTDTMTTFQAIYEPIQRAGFPRDPTRFLLFSLIRFTIGWTADEQVAMTRGTARPQQMNDRAFEFGVRAIILGAQKLVALGANPV